VDEKERILEIMIINKVSGGNIRLNEEDYPEIIDLFL